MVCICSEASPVQLTPALFSSVCVFESVFVSAGVCLWLSHRYRRRVQTRLGIRQLRKHLRAEQHKDRWSGPQWSGHAAQQVRRTYLWRCFPWRHKCAFDCDAVFGGSGIPAVVLRQWTQFCGPSSVGPVLLEQWSRLTVEALNKMALRYKGGSVWQMSPSPPVGRVGRRCQPLLFTPQVRLLSGTLQT